MQARLKSTALALLIGAAGAAAHAQSPRERQELVDAVRAGTLMHGEAESQRPDTMLRSRPRAEVRAELDVAQRNGETLAAGESGLPLNEVNPRAYPARAVVASRSRAEVKAEVREAARDGGLLASGELALPLNRLHQQGYAYREPMRAVAVMPAASAPIAMAR
ncbi:MAG TPA: hypothetical protein VFZ28_15945 [Burkholderiaceae bacterium]|nr:hypothetical protein [Burkholderiaceae bacterium]